MLARPSARFDSILAQDAVHLRTGFLDFAESIR
jgi:hypothetical protein